MGRTIEIPKVQTPWGLGGVIEDRYKPMVEQLEAFSRDHPEAYRWRVLGAALMGYAFLALVLGGLIVLTVGVVVIAIATHLVALLAKVAIVFLVMGFYLVRALWIRFETPKGVVVAAREAPALFAALEEIRRLTRGPKVKKVLVTDEFNAAIVQVPRLGIFGCHDNYLLLGLPLLMALSESEVKAVIAHEYGHLAGAHGKLSAWIYRVRQTWVRLSYAFETGGMASVLKGFFNWYGPWFNAYSFVLARSNEYEADRCAALVAGPATAASALVRVSAEGHRFAAHWDALQNYNRTAKAPATLPYAGLAMRFAEQPAEADQAQALSEALKRQTDLHDTHPCLSDRLAALGEATPALAVVEYSGAKGFLGDALTTQLVERFDAEWWREAAPVWEDIYKQAESMRARRRELDTMAAQGSLDEEPYWERVNLIEYEGDVATAQALAEAWAQSHPDDLIVRRRVAQFYLDQGDAKGVEHMQPVLDGADHGQREQALYGLAAYYAQFDPDNPKNAQIIEGIIEAERFRERVQDHFSRLPPTTKLEPPHLPEATLSALKRVLAVHYAIKSLWIARRSFPNDPAIVQYIALYICRDRKAEMDIKNAFMDDVLRVLQPHGAALAVESVPAYDWLRRRLVHLEGSEVRRDSTSGA
jgi:Zn-dependent protease with chaperone function